MKRQKKWSVLLMLALAILLLLNGCGSNNEDKAVAEPEEEAVVLKDYKIAEKGDVSFGNVIRLDWNVVISEPITHEELKHIAVAVVEQAKSETDFNAIVVFFYDYPDYIGRGMTLGKAEYAPGGDWSKADSVKTGDYRTMEYQYKLYKKDWSKQLSAEEVEVYSLYKSIYDEKDTATDFPDEDEVIQEVADQLGIDIDAVDEILWKQAMWMMDGS